MSVHLVPHPLIHDALSLLRDINTDTEQFRQIANRISVLLVAEALRDLPTERAVVQTPLEKAEGRRVARDVVVVPVLRAGLGMLDAVLELLPAARGRTKLTPLVLSRETTCSCMSSGDWVRPWMKTQ